MPSIWPEFRFAGCAACKRAWMVEGPYLSHHAHPVYLAPEDMGLEGVTKHLKAGLSLNKWTEWPI